MVPKQQDQETTKLKGAIGSPFSPLRVDPWDPIAQ